MDDEAQPFDSERPPDETWWERELHRNEKLMDKYMAVLGDNPDWDKWQNPEDLYNKVHFDIDPPARVTEEKEKEEEQIDEPETAEEDGDWLGENKEDELSESGEEFGDPDEDPELNENYPTVATQARRFACAVFDLGDDVPTNAELLFLSAGKVGANLAGGHGLGYDDESICGNIVKCRWALSDCEFCREMLEQLYEKTGDERYMQLVEESRHLAETLRERIERLRHRVWW
jgi:hypothetical protein